mgnify:CR=1 FL=1
MRSRTKPGTPALLVAVALLEGVLVDDHGAAGLEGLEPLRGGLLPALGFRGGCDGEGSAGEGQASGTATALKVISAGLALVLVYALAALFDRGTGV